MEEQRLCPEPRGPQGRGPRGTRTDSPYYVTPTLPPGPAFTAPTLEFFPSYLPVLSNLCSKVKLHGYRPGKVFLAATQRKNPLSTKPSQAHVVGPLCFEDREYTEWQHAQHRTHKTYLNQSEFRYKDRSGWKEDDSHIASIPKRRLTETLAVCRTPKLMTSHTSTARPPKDTNSTGRGQAKPQRSNAALQLPCEMCTSPGPLWSVSSVYM